MHNFLMSLTISLNLWLILKSFVLLHAFDFTTLTLSVAKVNYWFVKEVFV